MFGKLPQVCQGFGASEGCIIQGLALIGPLPGGFPKLGGGTFLGGPYCKDHSICEFISGSPYLGSYGILCILPGSLLTVERASKRSVERLLFVKHFFTAV